MAITNVNELKRERKGDESFDSGKTLTRVFQVIGTSDINANEALGASAGGGSVPSIGDAYPNGSIYTCNQKKAEQTTEDGCFWEVTCTYSLRRTNSGNDPNSSNDPEKPWNNKAIISYTYRGVRITLDKVYAISYDGSAPTSGSSESAELNEGPLYPVLNSANDQFDPGVVDEKDQFVITIQRSEKTIDPNKIRKIQNTLNIREETIAGVIVPVHHGRMRNITPRKAFTPNGSSYWDVTYEIILDDSTHIMDVLDAGYNYLDAEGEKHKIQIDGEDASEPQLLDGSGGKLDTTEAGWEPVFVKMRTRRHTNWNVLNLPTSENG